MLLCLPLLLAGLASCHETQPHRISDLDPERRGDPESLMKEFRENAEGVKKAASTRAAGAPVHVDTSVPPPTAASAHHEHTAGDPKGC